MAVAAVGALIGGGVAAAVGSSIAIGVLAGAAAGALFDYVIESAVEDAQADTMNGRTVTQRDPVGTRKILYGKCRTGGTIVYLANSGSNNKYLHQITCFAMHEVESIEEIWLGDKQCMKRDNGTIKYYNGWSANDDGSASTTRKFIYLAIKNGTSDQTKVTSEAGDKALPSQWTSNHRLRGIAYTYTRFDLDDGNPYDGQPNISAVIKGRKLYDPRKDSTSGIYDSSLGVSNHRRSSEANWQYSNNSALCLLDYLLNDDYGCNIPYDEIDEDALETALNICDEDVDVGSGTQKRYTCDGVIDTASSLRNNVAAILSSMNGRMTFSGGKFYIDAYAYKTPHTVTLDEDMLVGNFVVRSKGSKRDLYNQVRGTFMSEDENYQLAEFPTQTANTYVDDDGEVLEHDMKLSMTTSHQMAQRLARLTLLRSRMQETIKADLNMKGLQYRVGENIKVSNTKFGITNKIYEITRLSIKPSLSNGITVSIEARETASEIFTWTSSTLKTYDTGQTIQLYDPYYVDAVESMVVLPMTYATRDYHGAPAPSSGFRVNFNKLTDPTVYYRVRFQQVGTGRINSRTVYGEDAPSVELKDLESNADYEITIVSVNKYGREKGKLTETHKTGRITDWGGGSYTYTTTDDVSAMTESDFYSYFGKFAQNGDQLTIMEIDSNQVVVDSRTYVYQAELVYQNAIHSVKIPSYPEWYPHFPRSSFNFNPISTHYMTAPVAYEDVTWTATVDGYFCSDQTQNALQTFTNLTLTEVEDNHPNGSTLKIEIHATLAQLASRSRVDGAAFGYTHDVYFETGQITITAAWDQQSVSESFDAFIAVEYDS